jgi:hypothetical protein
MKEGKLDIKCKIKESNPRAYLMRNSAHPKHCLISWVGGEIIRYLRNSSRQQDFEDARNDFRKALMRRGYNQKELDPVLNAHSWGDRKRYLYTQKNRKPQKIKLENEEKIYLVMPWTPGRRAAEIKKYVDKALEGLKRSGNWSKIASRIRIAWRVQPNLRRQLTKAKL